MATARLFHRVHRFTTGCVWVGTVLMSLWCSQQACSQVSGQTIRPKKQPPVAPYPRITIALTAGGGQPESRRGLKDFWLRGPSGASSVMISVDRYHAFGMGLEGTLLYFNKAGFANRWPGVALQARNIAFLNAYLAWKLTMIPQKQTTPYLSLNAGIGRLTGARYQEIVNGVRTTYYDISGRTRLTLGAAAGVDIMLTRGFALEAEVKSTYVHNDPDVGIMIFLRGGVKLTV